MAKDAHDRIEKRNSVRLAIKKVPHSPDDQTQRVSILNLSVVMLHNMLFYFQCPQRM